MGRCGRILLFFVLAAVLTSCRPVVTPPPDYDALAKADLNYALQIARDIYAQDGSYVGADAPEMELRGPALSYVDGDGSKSEVGLSDQSDTQIALTKQSTSDWFFCIMVDGPRTDYGKAADAAACKAFASTNGWSS